MRCRSGSDMNPTSGFSMAIGPSQARLMIRSVAGRISNIYSHLIPAISFLLGEFYVKQYHSSRYSGVTGAYFILLSIFILTAVTCLSLSATYHTLINHSQHVKHFCLRLDMLGIVIFILGDLILGIYITFWCEPLPRNIYWSMVSQSPSARFCFSSIQIW